MRLFPSAPNTALAVLGTSSAILLDRLVVEAIASPPSLTVHEGFLSSDEVAGLLQNIKIDTDSINTYFGPTVLSSTISERLRDLGGTCAANADPKCSCAGEEEAVVMTLHMTATTDKHQDCHVPQTEGRVVKDDVAFVFLESSEGAHFEHGEAQKVPVIAGNLVKFRGDVPHRTVVPAGSPPVRIAGPFHLKSMEYVGSCAAECDGPEDCKGGDSWGPFYSECKNCAVIPKRNRRKLGEDDLKKSEAKGRAIAGLRGLSVEQDFHRAMQEDPDAVETICYCREAKGACCYNNDDPDGPNKCLDGVTHQTCMSMGAYRNPVFFGGGSACRPGAQPQCPINVQIPTGQCCFHDRASMHVQLSFCEVFVDGMWMGPGTNWQSCPPKESYGACCLENQCRFFPETQCLQRPGAVFKGAGTKCHTHCMGSCCGGALGCRIMTETAAPNQCSAIDESFAVGQDCIVGKCPKKCEAIFRDAETIAFPPNGGTVTVGGNTFDGANYKDTFPSCGATIMDPPVKSLIYNLVATSDQTLTISTCDKDVDGAYSSFDSSITVYEGDCDDLDCVIAAQNGKNGCSGGYGPEGGATVEFCAEKGKTYRIMVHGMDAYCEEAMGDFVLAIRDDGFCGTTTTTTIPPPTTTTTTTTSTTTTTTPPPTTTTTTTTSTTTTTTPPPTTTTTTSTTTTPPPTTTTTTTTTTTKPLTTTTKPCPPWNPLGEAGDYNAFIKYDFHATGADSCLAIAVGGDAKLPTGWSSGISQQNEYFPGPKTDYVCYSNGKMLHLTMVVFGDVHLPHTGAIKGGLVAGSISGPGSPADGTTPGEKLHPSHATPFSVSDCAVVLDEPPQAGLEPTLPDIPASFDELEALSQQIKGWTNQDPAEIYYGSLKLDASNEPCGTGPKVFDVYLNDVANVGYNVQIHLIGNPACPDETFIINWLGSRMSYHQMLTVSFHLTNVEGCRVFHNFPDAEALYFYYIEWVGGALLAPNADIVAIGGNVFGNVVAESWTGTTEFECGGFCGNICPPE